MKKIIIIYATAGEGHKRAAFALKSAFDITGQRDIDIKIIDALDYSNKLYKWLYPRMYLFMVTYIPAIWGLFYYLLDLKMVYPLMRFVRRAVNKANTAPLEKFLRALSPDVIITTHFLASEVISNLKAKWKLKTRLVTCVTDFRMHSFWFSNETDLFCVGFEETKGDLIKKWDIDPKMINVSGIPIDSRFYETMDRQKGRGRLGLAKDAFTVLITGGGFGVGPIIDIVKSLISMEMPLQILVVCGHNEKLKRQIGKLSTIKCEACPKDRRSLPEGDHKLSTLVKAYGFVDYMDELMAVSDIAITKAGGLICSEALAKELPLIIIAPIPGQESRNSRLLARNRAAFRIYRPSQVKDIIKKIYLDRTVLDAMKENIKRIKKENSAVNITKIAMMKGIN